MIIETDLGARADGVYLTQRTSGLGVKLLQVETNKTYDSPIDVEPCPYTYEETDIPIDDDTDINVQKAEAYDYLMEGSADNE